MANKKTTTEFYPLTCEEREELKERIMAAIGMFNHLRLSQS